MLDYLLHHNSFKYTPDDISGIFRRKIYIDIIKSRPFTRLKNIHFLGAIDYALGCNKERSSRKNTRYHHSLGVAKLALIFAKLKKFNPEDEVLCVVAALLHDIGHAPLSHSMESVFKDRLDFGHHEASEKIIKGEVKNLASIWKIIDSNGINVFKVLEILNGVGEQRFREAFDYPINIDTAEGILRCIDFVNNYKTTISPNDVVQELACLNPDSTEVLDVFWRAKDFAYGNLINARVGVLADYVSQSYMNEYDENNEDHDIYDDFFNSEVKFKEKHNEVFRRLKELEVQSTDDFFGSRTKIKYFRRVFEINNNISIGETEDLRARYIQTKFKEIIFA